MEDTPKSRWIVEALDLHERSLIRYASWILNDIECAREVVQETFLRLCKEEPCTRFRASCPMAVYGLPQSGI